MATVKEAAEQFGLDNVEARNYLGKQSVNDEITGNEFESLATYAQDGPPEAGPQPAPPVQQEVCVFISMARRHKISIPVVQFSDGSMERATLKNGKTPNDSITLPFTEFRCIARKGGLAEETIRSLHSQGFMELRQGRFTDGVKRTQFRDMLRKKVLTGQHQEPATDSGHAFLLAWLRQDEHKEASRILNESGGFEALIDYIVDNKSYVQV